MEAKAATIENWEIILFALANRQHQTPLELGVEGSSDEEIMEIGLIFVENNEVPSTLPQPMPLGDCPSFSPGEFWRFLHRLLEGSNVETV